MTFIGQIIELWRYPVSSIGGERMDHLQVGSTGVDGDRGFLLIDAQTGRTASPESDRRWHPALHLAARLRDRDLPEIGFPDGQWHRLDEPSLSHRLADHFAFPVAVARAASNAGGAGDTRFPVAEPRYAASPVHLVTTAALSQLAHLAPGLGIDSRRFRPTIVVGTGLETGFAENEWIGREITAGPVGLWTTGGTKRCAMTMIAQPDLNEDPEILRTIVRHNRRNLGVYCSVSAGGMLTLGDAVRLAS